MSDWRALLRAHDPAAEAIEAVRAERMRRAVLDAARHATPQASPWTWRFALAGATVVLLAAGAGDVGRMSGDRLAPLPPTPSGERRQVQFDTPGGTRIIWEINPDFDLGETIP
jgi:ferric-dicitrate binding protein FerR (iron transport regulator)